MKTTDNTAMLQSIKVNPSRLTWFADTLKHWYKQAGSKPTDAMLMAAVLMGLRPGVQALHIAMCLRPEGCTVSQFVLAGSCGPANNIRRDLVKAGYFTCKVEGKPYAFILTVTAKGQQRLDKAQAAAEAEASMVDAPKGKKAARKRRLDKAKAAAEAFINSLAVTAKAKAAPVTDVAVIPATVETPASDAPSATEGQTVDPAQLQALAAQFNG